MELHISDLNTFDFCRRKWWFTSEHALNLEPLSPEEPLFFGSGIHKALELCYQPGEPDYDAMAPAFINWFGTQHTGKALTTELEGIFRLGLSVLKHYAEWASATDKFTVVASELPFEVPLPDGHTYAGRFDGVVRSKETGRLWLKEFKTSSYNLRKQSESSRYLLDTQASAYLWAAKQVFDEPVHGIAYTLIRKKAPATPTVLKSGLLSKNKSIDTTPARYLRAARQLGISLDEGYRDFLLDLAAKEAANPFFHRFLVYRTPEELEDIGERLALGAEEIEHAADGKPTDDVYNPPRRLRPSPTFRCQDMCAFVDPCLTMNRKQPVASALSYEYRQRQSNRGVKE